MNRLLVFGSFVMITLLLFSLTGSAEMLYHQIMVPMPSPGTIRALQEIGCDLECGSQFIKGEGLQIVVDDVELALIRERGIPCIVTVEDMVAHDEATCLKNLEKIPFIATDDDPIHMKYGSMGGFYTFQEIVADLDSMNLLYPDLVAEKSIIGYGWENHPVYMVKISDNVNVNEDEPEVFIDALHHAREPGGYTATLYAMWYLLENYGIDPEVTYLVDNREMYFVPVANPDGLLYNQQTNPYGGGNWRKNRRNNGSSYGVDLNRNYTYQWGYDNIGSSGTPSSSTYRGPSAGSEPEVQALMTFVNEHNIKTAMTVHTSGGHYLSAYGYDDVQPEHYTTHMDYMNYAAAENGYNFGTCYDILYASNGRTQDWQLHTHDIINIEPEIGYDGFWPDIQYIMPEAQENLNCFLNQFWCAGGQVIFQSLDVTGGYLDPGATEELVLSVFNRGWGESEPVTFELETSDPYVTLNASTVNVGTIPQYTVVDNSANPFTADIAPETPIGHQVNFTVTINQGTYVRTETVTLSVGTPVVYFSDGAENGMGNWSVSGGWGTDNTQQHSGNYSFNESPYNHYANNLTAIMTIASPLNLSELSSCWLDYWARWDIESQWDFCQIEVSTNGSSWTPMEGLYTNAGSGIGVQPAGEPGYDGSQATWVHEMIDLDSYAGQSNLWFRFEFKSDGGVYGDGFFVDDIQLLGYGGAPPVGEVSVDLTYISGSPVPAGGGNLVFDIYALNYGSVPLNYDAWLAIEYEGGPPTTVVLRNLVNFQPGWAINRPATYYPIPAAYAAGNYEFYGRVGQHPAVVWDESFFPFVKSGTNNGESFTPYPVVGAPNPFDQIDKGDGIEPAAFALKGAYPNPFNPTTTISFKLQNAGFASLTVFDIQGREVATLVDGYRNAGLHEVTYDGSGLASGVYLIKLQTDKQTAISKMVLLK